MHLYEGGEADCASIAVTDLSRVISRVLEYLIDNTNARELRELLYDPLINSGAVGAYILLCASVIILCCGRRLLPIFRIPIFFCLGYLVGGLISDFAGIPEVPHYVLSLALSALLVLLSRLLYDLLFALVPALGAFLLIWSGAVIPSLADNLVPSLIIAFTTAALFLYFKRYFEILGISLAGAYGACFAISAIIPSLHADLVVRVVAVSVLALVGFFLQLRRER